MLKISLSINKANYMTKKRKKSEFIKWLQIEILIDMDALRKEWSLLKSSGKYRVI